MTLLRQESLSPFCPKLKWDLEKNLGEQYPSKVQWHAVEGTAIVFLSSEVTYILKHVFESSPCTRLIKYFVHINHSILYNNPTFSSTPRTVGCLLTNIWFPFCICAYVYFLSTAPQLLNKEYVPFTQTQPNDFQFHDTGKKQWWQTAEWTVVCI